MDWPVCDRRSRCANAYWVRFPDGGRKSVHASQLRPYVARTDQVGVIFDNERQFGDLQTCPSSDDFEPTCDDRFDKFELVRLLSVQRPLVASWKELADNLYEKGANQVVAFVVRKDRVGIG